MRYAIAALLLAVSLSASAEEILWGGPIYNQMTWGQHVVPVNSDVACDGSRGVAWWDNPNTAGIIKVRMYQNSLSASNSLNADITLQTTIHQTGRITEVVEEKIKLRQGEPTNPMNYYNFGPHYFTMPPNATIATFITCEPRGKSTGTIRFQGKAYLEWDR